MQLKPMAAIIVLLLVVASLLAAGCTVSTTSPTNSPSPTPIPDYSQRLDSQILQNPDLTAVNSMAIISNNTYVGTYRSYGNDSTWKVQLFDNESDAQASYGTFVLQKTDAGFVSNSSDTVSSPVFGDATASWAGSKLESLVSGSVIICAYGHDDDINQWYVTSITQNIE